MSSGSPQPWFPAGGGCKGGHFARFVENFGTLLTAAGFAPDRDDAGWLAARRDGAGWLAEPALLEDGLAFLELTG